MTLLPALAVNPATGTTTTGQPLSVQINSPTDGATVPAGNVAVTGQASAGSSGGASTTNVMYIIDVSGSTASPDNQDCNGDGAVNAADDFNGNGDIGETIDCEISSILALNGSLVNSGVEAGVVQFSSGASALDVNPATAGMQAFTSPGADADANSVRDIDQAARTLTPSGGTNFDAALDAMNAAFASQPAGERNVAFFLSDGVASVDTAAGSPLAAAQAAGTVVNTFSVGSSGAGCDPSSALRQIADTTGGTCTEVSNPSTLAATLSGTTLSGISRVELRVDGGAPINATIDALGNWTASVPVTGAGTHTITATAVATDGSQVTADIRVTIAGSTTPPPTPPAPTAPAAPSNNTNVNFNFNFNFNPNTNVNTNVNTNTNSNVSNNVNTLTGGNNTNTNTVGGNTITIR